MLHTGSLPHGPTATLVKNICVVITSCAVKKHQSYISCTRWYLHRIHSRRWWWQLIWQWAWRSLERLFNSENNKAILRAAAFPVNISLVIRWPVHNTCTSISTNLGSVTGSWQTIIFPNEFQETNMFFEVSNHNPLNNIIFPVQLLIATLIKYMKYFNCKKLF